jgi:hypothetical protein
MWFDPQVTPSALKLFGPTVTPDAHRMLEP